MSKTLVRRLLISIHSDCQYRCRFCLYGHGRRKNGSFKGRLPKLGTKQWLAIIRDGREAGFDELEIGGRGEPTLNPDLGTIVKAARNLGYRISLLSNIINYSAIIDVLPSLSSLTINLNALTESEYKRLHRPVGVSFADCVSAAREIFGYCANNKLKVEFSINYVVSHLRPGDILFPERVNRLFRESLGGSRIHVNFQHMHSYVRGAGGRADKSLRSALDFVAQNSRNRLISRCSNLHRFIEKTTLNRTARSAQVKAGNRLYTCLEHKRLMFVDSNGDLYGCFNPFRVANGMPLSEEHFYYGNIGCAKLRDVLAEQRRLPLIDVSKKYWKPCVFCRAKVLLGTRLKEKRV